MFVRNDLPNDWMMEVVDYEVENILWLKLECSERGSIMMSVVCYLPPMSSNRGLDVYERLSRMEEQVEKFVVFGIVVVCGHHQLQVQLIKGDLTAFLRLSISFALYACICLTICIFHTSAKGCLIRCNLSVHTYMYTHRDAYHLMVKVTQLHDNV